MKEILYLDTKLTNSLLAQKNAGLVTKLMDEETNSNTNSENGGGQTTYAGAAGANYIGKLEVSASSTEIDSYSVVFSKSNRNLIETALDDYSLDVLLDSLKGDIKTEDYSIGDIVLVNDNISIYNFEHIVNAMELRGIGDSLDGFNEYLVNRAKLVKLKKADLASAKNQALKNAVESSSWNNIYLAKIMAEYVNSIFPNSTLIKIADTLSICDNDMMRVKSALMSFNNNSNRKAFVLGIVTSKIDERIPQNFDEAQQSDGLYRQATNIFGNIILGSNNIIDEEDFVIRPIAIFFEH